MFTASGTWFHVTRADLEDYAGEVLKRVELERLVTDAESVVRSPQVITVWMLLGLLFFTSPAQAALAAAVMFLAWSVVGPGFVTLPILRLYRALDLVPLQGLAYVTVLSVLANQGNLVGLGTGLAGFVLLRWGVVGRILDPIAAAFRKSLYRLPLADQALRAVIVRHALATGSRLAELDDMERRMLDIAHRRGNSRRSEPE